MKPYRTMERFKSRRQPHETPRLWPADILSFFLLMTVMTIHCSGCSRYQNLSADYDAYRPPILATVPALSVPDSGKQPPAADDFTNEQQRIASLAKTWSAALNDPEKDSRFYSPPPDRLTALKSTAGDEAAAVLALSPEFTLETFQILALYRNPGVTAAEKTFHGKLQAYSQVAGLDDMLRSYAVLTRSVMPGIGNMADRESPAMKFPFPGILALKGEIVTQEIMIARQVLETARKTAVSESRRLYWRWIANRRVQEMTRAVQAILDQLELSARKRYEVGQESLQAVLRVQIQQLRSAEELTTLCEEQKTLQVSVRSLLDLHPSADIGIPQFRDPRREMPNLDRISALAFEHRQELKTVRAMIGRMERMIEMAETEIYPPFTQNLSLFENRAAVQVGTVRTEDPFADVFPSSVGEGLPKNPWFGMEDAYLRETRENLTALRSELKKTENDTRFKVRDAWFRLDQAMREERLYMKKMTELTRLSSEITANRYEAGVAELRDVIDFYMMWFDARLTGERKKADIGIARADLEEIVGISF